MEETKILEIYEFAIDLYDTGSCCCMNEMIHKIENGYIFGEYATNEHYRSKDLSEIVKSVYAEKAPVIEIDPEV